MLLTPGDMGPGEWSDVAHVLTSRGHQVLLDTDLSYDRGILSAAGTQLQRLHDSTFWALRGVQHVDVAVGIGMGAGPAAAMAAEGRARSAVLIDPDLTAFATTHPDNLDQLAPDAKLELAAEIGTRLEPYADNLTYGPLTREMVDILCGVFTADMWRQRQADLVAHFLTSRVATDRSLRPTPANLQASDWTAAAATAPVRIWLTAGNESIDTALRDAGLNVTLTAWGPAPWIQSPDELSSAIETTTDPTIP
ncbi:hypothetical protein SAMN04488544_2480 [Microlunatus sagamiharensis]|uniref:Alpha/beta hydrolase family protein n=1 Tax=Microlunatus sagamiharensis TaxID=546874 RepID=A0A1H2MPM8_9ACTN|nr:hypothetical protein [Microlunatus sagamiharensis]SDU95193.1 hypothetical protein SAMN04488544_2480 [Microlunatus sagamiharensis]